MKEKPIIFSGEMVRAILEGRKTQTRRVIKPQPEKEFWGHWLYFKSKRSLYSGKSWGTEEKMRRGLPEECPYGQAEDRLWVRETWATPGNYDHIKPSELAVSHFSSSELVYRATEQHGDVYYKWRPSIFMPRWASRITLEITGVRVELVQEITKEDILAEGLPDRWQQASNICHLNSWIALWDSINAKRGYGWKENPWVWVIEFQCA